MQVLDNRVLVEQLMVAKKSKIILGKDVKADEKFDVSFKVLALGPGVPKDTLLKVGDKPIFGKYVDFHGVKVIEKTADKEVLHVIVMYDDIIGIDD